MPVDCDTPSCQLMPHHDGWHEAQAGNVHWVWRDKPDMASLRQRVADALLLPFLAAAGPDMTVRQLRKQADDVALIAITALSEAF